MRCCNCISSPHAHPDPAPPPDWSNVAAASPSCPFENRHPTGFQFTVEGPIKKKINLEGAWDLVRSLGLLTEARSLKVADRVSTQRLNYVVVVPPDVFKTYNRRLSFKRTIKDHKNEKSVENRQRMKKADADTDEKRISILNKVIIQHVVTCAHLEKHISSKEACGTVVPFHSQDSI